LDLLVPGKGASVQYTVMQNRRYADVSNEFAKGSPSVASASSNVYWAVPFVGEGAESLTAIKVNEDAPIVINSNGPLGIFANIPAVSDGDISLSFQTGEIESDSHTEYKETINKQEDQQQIVNRRTAQLKDTIDTKIKYKVKIGVSDISEELDDLGLPTEVTIAEGTLADLKQGLYKDSDGQYRYREDAVGTTVERQKQWETPFVR